MCNGMFVFGESFELSSSTAAVGVSSMNDGCVVLLVKAGRIDEDGVFKSASFIFVVECFLASGDFVDGELLNEFVFEDNEDPAPDNEDMEDVSKLVDSRSMLLRFLFVKLEDCLLDSAVDFVVDLLES